VHFLGEVDDVRAVLTRCHALLVTSTREGLPGVVLEGLSVGTPCLSSDLPGSTFIKVHIDGIEVLSLSESDECWASALRAIVLSDSTQARAARAESFANSIFTSKKAAASMTDLWLRQ
jgi:glycosyltransferase involved in cell wall biosynthesis